MMDATPTATAARAGGDQRSRGDRTDHVDLSVGGMTCPHCPATIEKSLKAVAGVKEAHVNRANALAAIDYDPEHATVSDLLQAIRSVGYTAGTAKIRIPIKHMHCASCVTRIELALQMAPGVVSAHASLGTGAVDVEYQPEQTDFNALRRAIESAGHKVAEPKPVTESAEGVLSPEDSAQREEYRSLMRKFWFAAIIAVPVMALSYPDLVPGLLDWMPAGSETRRVVWGLLGVLSIPVLLWSGSQFFTGMWDALKHRSANMHTLIAIGISAAFLYSIVAVAWPDL
ncbi:MAG: copper ion binding protein, partial [Rhodospirillales bacterium]|nr:copper ion binding protein [Rhodospirillales bacterium]